MIAIDKDSEIPTPLVQTLAGKFRFSLFAGPPVAAGYAIYYWYYDNHAAFFGLLFFLIIDLYVLVQLFFFKKSLLPFKNFLVLAMFVANVIPMYTFDNSYIELQWFIIFPFLYFHIAGYRHGVIWAVVYYFTAASIYLLSGKEVPTDVLVSAIIASLILTVFIAYYMKINEGLSRERIHSIAVFNHELNIAQKFQKAISPDGEIRFENVTAGVRYIPYYGISGDVFDIYQPEEGKIRIFIADISGHGVQSSLLGMSLKSIYYNFRDKKISPKHVLEKLNVFFYENFSIKGEFATAFILDIDSNKRKITYASAGHLSQIRFSDWEPHYLSTNGQPLGVSLESIYAEKKISYIAGDQLLLFTDGLIEGMQYPEIDRQYDALIEFVFPLLKQKPLELIDSLLEKLKLSGKHEAHLDDIAIISVRL